MKARSYSEETNFLSHFWLLETLLKNQHGQPDENNDSAKKWHQRGLHVRQKVPAPSAEVRRTTPEVVRAPPAQHFFVQRSTTIPPWAKRGWDVPIECGAKS